MFLEYFVIVSQGGTFLNFVFLYLYGIPFHAVVVFCSGPDLLFKSILTHCDLETPTLSQIKKGLKIFLPLIFKESTQDIDIW